jgi:hypothetical protein
LRYSGYRPNRWFQLDEARGATIRRVGILAVTIVVLSAFLGGVTYDSYRAATTEERIHETVDDIIDDRKEARLLSIEVKHSSDIVFRRSETVVVMVGVESDNLPALANPIDAAIERATDHEIRTEVRYVQVASA